MVGDPCRKPFFVSLDEEDEYITILGEEGVQFLVLSMGLVDGLIYTASDESFISCLDAATGHTVWAERVGGKFIASPIYGDGRIYFPSQDGATFVIKPGRELNILATNTLADGFMACPAASGKALYLRSKTALYSVEQQ